MKLRYPWRVFCALAIILVETVIGGPGRAQEPVSFQGKTLTMLVGAEPGGGTDIFGRIILPFLSNALPGKPTIVARNMPGANGIVVLNYFVKQAAPDGYTFVVGSGTQVDPFTYRFSNAQYDLTKLEHIGGAGRSGTALIVNRKALPRLYDKSQPPVAMGALSAVRSGMMMTLWGGEYLSWNVKWVIGYRGAHELMLALSRGEIDMTSMAVIDQIDAVKKVGDFVLIAQSGTVENGKLVLRPEFGNTPAMATMVEDKITDPIARKAFAHWKAIITVGQWLALPPGTPKPFTETYRAAFKKVFADPEFRKQALRVDSGMFEVSPEDMLETMTVLANTPNEALTFLEDIAKKQGLSGFK